MDGIDGAGLPYYALPFASESIRFETCPTFSGCRIFIDNRPRYTSSLFNIEIEKEKKEILESVFNKPFFNKPSNYLQFTIINSMDVVSIVHIIFFFSNLKEMRFFDHSFESNFNGFEIRVHVRWVLFRDRFQSFIVFLKKMRFF